MSNPFRACLALRFPRGNAVRVPFSRLDDPAFNGGVRVILYSRRRPVAKLSS